MGKQLLAKKAPQKTFPGRLRLRQPQVCTDHGLQLVFVNIGAFNDDFITHHDRGSRGQIQLEVLVRLVLGDGLGNYLAFELVFFAQPGHHLEKMLSGLAIGLVEKESNFQHFYPPLGKFFKKTLTEAGFYIIYLSKYLIA
jgi:hypothetical protein